MKLCFEFFALFESVAPISSYYDGSRGHKICIFLSFLFVFFLIEFPRLSTLIDRLIKEQWPGKSTLFSSVLVAWSPRCVGVSRDRIFASLPGKFARPLGICWSWKFRKFEEVIEFVVVVVVVVIFPRQVFSLRRSCSILFEICDRSVKEVISPKIKRKPFFLFPMRVKLIFPAEVASPFYSHSSSSPSILETSTRARIKKDYTRYTGQVALSFQRPRGDWP